MRLNGCILVVGLLIFSGCDKPADKAAGSSSGSSTSPASATDSQRGDSSSTATDSTIDGAAQSAGSASTDSAAMPTTQANPNLRRAEHLKGAGWELDENTHDFGLAWAGQAKMHTFYLKNTGTETLEIYEMKPSCYCVSTERLPARVLPNKAASIRFRADLSGRVGPFLESMTLVTNDPQQPYVVMEMRGEVRMPAVQEVIYDSSLPGGGDQTTLAKVRALLGQFGEIRPDVPLKRILRIRNASGQPLKLSLLPMFPAETPFSASLKETKPGDEYELTIEGRPPFAEGTTEARISLQTNIRDFDRFMIPIGAKVVGRIEVRPQRIVVNPDRAVVLDRRITIRHDGTRPFTITGLFASDAAFDLRMLPQDPTKPNEWRATLRLPGPAYIPPPWGDLVRFETTDGERPTIDIPIIADPAVPPAPRPEHMPIAWQPGMMPPAR